jgi:potassium-dependent mechanosensitive channel
MRLKLSLRVTHLCMLVICAFMMDAGFAQVKADLVQARMDSAKQALEQVEAALTRKDLSDAELSDLRSQIDIPAVALQSIVEELTPKQAAIKTRLDQLGAKPGDKDPPESPGVTTERSDQEKLFNQIDETVRKGRLLAVQADQLKSQIGVRRHAMFTRALLERTSSILSPNLWLRVAKELPQDLKALKTVFTDWISGTLNHLTYAELMFLLAVVVAASLIYRPLTRVASYIVNRDETIARPSPLRKVTAALGLALVTAAVPIGLMAGLALILDSFDILIPRLQPVNRGIFEAVTRISLTLAIARALLAPRRPNWRLLDLASSTAVRLAQLAVLVAIIVSASKILEAIDDVIAATLPLSVATRASGALAVALVIAASIRRIEPHGNEINDKNVPPGSDRTFYGSLRLVTWALIVAIILAVLIGYVAFAAFLVEQIVWVSGVGSLLYMLLVLVDDGITTLLQADSRISRSIIASVGLRRESLDQIAVLLAGMLRVSILAIAGMLILAPWGIESDDMLSYMKAAFFGLKVGDVNIALSTIVVSVLLFLAGFIATRAIQRWLDAKFLPHTQLDTGLRNSIKTSLGYVGVTIAAAIALSHVGLSFDKFAIVAGALSVGIGFGLQSIVSNFVSGLILLWERAIRVGDWIVVGEEQGFVRRINVRSTEIETFDRATVIMPNSNIVSGVVKNWVRTDRVGRITIDVRAPYDCDPEQVRKILMTCAKANDQVLAIPAPLVLFSHFGESALHFQLMCFVDDVLTAVFTKSDLHYAIFSQLKAAGITIPYTQRDVTIRGLENFGIALRNPQAD